jgi:AraC-like DNA-binding protein
MELLTDFDGADPVGWILRVIRDRSTVYCRSLLGVPWGFGVKAHGNPAFHVVTSGSCSLHVDGEPGHLTLGTGDLVVVPAGRRHWIRDDPTTGAAEIAAAIDLIHREPDRAWTVGDAAAGVALSRSAFSARFRELVGEPPRRYITRTRLARAAVLLHTTGASIAEIAGRAGYGTEFSFAKAFKRVFGVAPVAYRGQPSQVPGLSPGPDAATLAR